MSKEKVTLNKQQFETLKSTLVHNASIYRQEILNRLLNTGRDIDSECGYPADIQTEEYFSMYKRHGIAARVVDVWADDCWTQMPMVYEKEEAALSPFEIAWRSLQTQKNLLPYLSRIDKISGIGEFGVLLMGFDDKKQLDKPLENLNPITGEIISTTPKKQLKLTFLKPLAQDCVTVSSKVTDASSPRYGLPEFYSIQFSDVANNVTSISKIHWSRVIHVADNREESDIIGVPRMKNVYNWLLDIKKVLGGSGEMFWKGGFPGYSFEVAPTKDGIQPEIDSDSVADQVEDYSQGLQRYLILEGLTAKSLSPQVADPNSHVETIVKAIAMAKGVPFRIFLGTEEGKLAGSQDKALWNARIRKRQESYLSPFVIRPMVDRFIAVGVLPYVEEYYVKWPDMSTPSDRDKADTANIRTEALAKYVQGEVETLVPPQEYMKIFLEMDEGQIIAIKEAAEKYEEVLEEKIEDEMARETRMQADIAKSQQIAKGAKESAKAKKPEGSL
jgi:hypothetical protein